MMSDNEDGNGISSSIPINDKYDAISTTSADERMLNLISSSVDKRMTDQRSDAPALVLEGIDSTSSKTDTSNPSTPKAERKRSNLMMKKRKVTKIDLEPLIKVCKFYQDSKDAMQSQPEYESVSDPGNDLVSACKGWCLETRPNPLEKHHPQYRRRSTRHVVPDGSGLSPIFDFEEFSVGARFYRQYFDGQDHQNFIGHADSIGSFVVSIRQEDVQSSPKGNSVATEDVARGRQYRIIVRSSKDGSQRMVLPASAVSDDGIPTLREIMQRILPQVPAGDFRQTAISPDLTTDILKLDECDINAKEQYKFGVLFARKGQSVEEEFYNNEHPSKQFIHFMSLIGTRVRLQGYKGFNAGLDVKNDATGTHSFATKFHSHEIMFHASPYLPFSDKDSQQVQRKSKIGNDIVVIVVQEKDAAPLDLSSFTTNFLHVMIIVRCLTNEVLDSSMTPDTPAFAVAVARKQDVPEFGPPLPGESYSDGRRVGWPDEAFVPLSRPNDAYHVEETILTKNEAEKGLMKHFLLTKAINAENASYVSGQLRKLSARTRLELLTHIVGHYGTEVSLADLHKRGSLARFLPSLGTKRRASDHMHSVGEVRSWKIRTLPSGRDAIQAELLLSDKMLAVCAISNNETLHNCALQSVQGWVVHSKGLQIYVGPRLDCITLLCSKPDRQSIIHELTDKTDGALLIEYALSRSTADQPWGFVVCDSEVRHMDPNGVASMTGLRTGDHILLMNGKPLSGLSEAALRQLAQLHETSLTMLVKVRDLKVQPLSGLASPATRPITNSRRGSGHGNTHARTFQELDHTPRSGRAFASTEDLRNVDNVSSSSSLGSVGQSLKPPSYDKHFKQRPRSSSSSEMPKQGSPPDIRSTRSASADRNGHRKRLSLNVSEEDVKQWVAKPPPSFFSKEDARKSSSSSSSTETTRSSLQPSRLDFEEDGNDTLIPSIISTQPAQSTAESDELELTLSAPSNKSSTTSPEATERERELIRELRLARTSILALEQQLASVQKENRELRAALGLTARTKQPASSNSSASSRTSVATTNV